MNKVEDIDTLTKELTNFLLKAKGEINRLKNQSKQDNDFKNAVKLKFKEIQDENRKLKQKLLEYDNYHKQTAIQKKEMLEPQPDYVRMKNWVKKSKKNYKNWLY